LASLFLQAGAVGLLVGLWFAGWSLASLGAAVLIARLEATGVLSRETAHALLAVLVIAALVSGSFSLYLRSLRGGFQGEKPEDTTGLGSGKYRGVILWAEAKPPVALIVPRPASGRRTNRSTQPLSIPFDGVYWFFKFPDRQPPKDSYSLRGSPSETAFRSSDSVPLEMEGRQNFVNLLEVSCCSHPGT
jgi:hypothetical protein